MFRQELKKPAYLSHSKKSKQIQSNINNVNNVEILFYFCVKFIT
jgi:hypothetical protein